MRPRLHDPFRLAATSGEYWWSGFDNGLHVVIVSTLRRHGEKNCDRYRVGDELEVATASLSTTHLEI